MKPFLRIVLSLLFLLIIPFIHASNRYWVGGSGSWSNASHWSVKSGGNGGASVPSLDDNVIIDRYSFSDAGQAIKINNNAACANFNWLSSIGSLEGDTINSLSAYGSFAFSAGMKNNFKGKVYFLSSSIGSSINTAGKLFHGDLVFNGSGSWLFDGDIRTDANTSILLLKGDIDANGKIISCGSFITKGSEKRKLDLRNSIIKIEKLWNFEETDNLEFIAGESELKLTSSSTEKFKSKGLNYNKITTLNRAANQPIVTVTQLEFNKCNGDCKAVLVATVSGGAVGPFEYQWGSIVTHTTTSQTDTLRNLCQQTLSVLVQDIPTVEFGNTTFSVFSPSALIVGTAITIPTCNGVCDGILKPTVTGGTEPYTYKWTPGGAVPSPGVLKNLCASAIPYAVTVTDFNNCVVTRPTLLTQPAILTANGTSTNINCFNVCDGTASTAPAGGTLPYTHSWSNGSHATSLANLCVGTYTDTIKDKNGCTALYTATITQPALLTLSTSKIDATCGGVCDGKATATITGGVAPYTYVWSTGSTTTTASTTNTVIALCAGTYTITVTDKNNCVKTGTVIVAEPAVLTAVASGTNISCFDACNGTATVSVSGGSGGTIYLWTPGSPIGANSNTISQLCAGTYTITVRDVNNCSASDQITITEPLILKATPTSTNISCFGSCNGTATASATGGTTPYAYKWLPILPPVTSTVISNLCPGTYSLVVTDIHNCKDTSSAIVITQPKLLVVGATKTDVSCNGACNGSATANPTDGTPPYTYSWAPGGQLTKTISSLCPGNYTATVTDANGCVKTQIVSIVQPNPLNVSLVSTNITCNALCNGSLSASVAGGTPGYSFLWAPGGEITASISNKCAGTYTVTVTDAAGCTRTATQTITQPTAILLNSAPITNVTCFGLCNGGISTLAVGGGGGFTYSWLPGNQVTNNISNLCSGIYSVTAKDINGCIASKTFTVMQPEQLLAAPAVVTNSSCSGACNGSAISTPTGGTAPFAYLWTPGNAINATAINLCSGTYSVKVTDGNNCTSTQPVTITQPTPVAATITGSTSSCNICNGSATASAVGGTGPYTYSWAPSGQTTVTATGLCPNTTYTVTVTDSKGCSAIANVTIQQTIIINITTSSTVLSCAGTCDGIASANASGGTAPYGYLWSGPGGPYSTQTVTNLCVGAYTVTVSDAAGCFNTTTVTFTNPPVLNIATSSTNATCFGVCDGTATGSPTGGTGTYTYKWMPGGQTTQIASGLCAGTYTLTVTDSKSCTQTATVAIAQPTAIVDHVSLVLAKCSKPTGAISVAPTGGTPGYTYDWDGGANPIGDLTTSISSLLAGVHTLAITDAAGCISNFSYLLNNIGGPTLTMNHANVSCHDACDGSASVAITGVGGYIRVWNPGNFTATNSISALCGTTTYTVQVTDDSLCVALDTATVINPPLLKLNEVVNSESCGGTCDGSISLNPSGGKPPYSYSWSNGTSLSFIENLCVGSYSVTVTDGNSCTATLTMNVVSPIPLAVTLSSTNILCKNACNGTATANVTGGTGGYTYLWTNQPASSILQTIVNLCPNQYAVTVKDAKGCIAKDTVDITEPAALTASTIKKDLSCHGVCNGLAVVKGSGGTLPYSYNWNPGAILNDTAFSLCAGIYNATVTDANGCVVNAPAITISEPSVISPNASFTDPLCNASCNGSVTSNAVGGTGAYTYLWTPGNYTTKFINNLCAGTYTVNITDSAGCTANQNVTLINPSILIANVSATSPSCVSSCNGSATTAPVGGTPGYSYLWLPGSLTNQTISNLCAGSYTVVVTDANNCIDTQKINVVKPIPVNVSISSTPSNCNACDGTILITPLTGIPGFTYSWSGGLPPKANQTNLCAAIYTVLVKDTVGCDSTFTIALSNSSGATGEIVSTTPVSCNGQCTGSGTVVPIGGTPPFSYLWNNTPIPASTKTASNLCAGSYFVEVKDSNSCIHFSPVTITQPSKIISHATITSATCSGVCTGKIALAPTGGTGSSGYSYLWSPGGQTTASLTALCLGAYSVTITDSASCTVADTFAVGQTSPLAATIDVKNVLCASTCTGKAYVSITTGTPLYTVQWNDPLAQTADTASALCAGNYAVTIKDALGCRIVLNATINENSKIVSHPSVTNATCGICDGAVTLATSGGILPYAYSWSNGQSSSSATNLCSGVYTVNVKDSIGCKTAILIPINNTNGPTGATLSKTDVSCYGRCDGAVTAVTPIGGVPPYAYSWIHNGQTTPTISGLCAGTYYLKISDNAGCSFIDSVVIDSPSPLVANQTLQTPSCTICDGGIQITPLGGVPPYTVLWNNGSTNTTLTNLCAGIYSVLISDANCTQNIVIPLNTKNGPTLSTSYTDIACNDSCNGTASVTAIGNPIPYSYKWSTGDTTSTISNLCAGNYIVQVKGAGGCATSSSVNIKQNAPVVINTGSTINPLCNGDATGSITIIPTGGKLPYTYAWTPASGNTATISSLIANNYSVIVTDSLGCIVSKTITLTDPLVLKVSHVVSNSSCNTTADGSIDITAAGGSLPYSFQWTGGSSATTEDLANLLSGTYTLTITDQHNCMVKDSAAVLPNQFVLANAGKDSTFCEAGSYLLNAQNSISGIGFKWFQLPANTNIGTTVSVSVNPPNGVTTYYVVVDNGSGCVDTDTIQLTSNLLPVANAGPDKNVYINKSIVIGGTPTTSTIGASIAWTPSTWLDNPLLNNPLSTPTATITYTVKVTSSEGCISVDSMVVKLLPTIDIPSGITPNGDGANDVWTLSGIEVFPDCVVELYNRWGELIFQSPGYNVKWDGTYKGELLPVGTYYYIIDLHEPSIPVFTGPITIMR